MKKRKMVASVMNEIDWVGAWRNILGNGNIFYLDSGVGYTAVFTCQVHLIEANFTII